MTLSNSDDIIVCRISKMADTNRKQSSCATIGFYANLVLHDVDKHGRRYILLFYRQFENTRMSMLECWQPYCYFPPHL